jgi:hypothetical protein
MLGRLTPIIRVKRTLGRSIAASEICMRRAKNRVPKLFNDAKIIRSSGLNPTNLDHSYPRRAPTLLSVDEIYKKPTKDHDSGSGVELHRLV